MEFLHVLTMFLGIVLMSAWMVIILVAILKSEILNKIGELWKPLGAVFLVMIFGFIARTWYVTAMDVQNIVNYIFSSCEPIDISKFG